MDGNMDEANAEDNVDGEKDAPDAAAEDKPEEMPAVAEDAEEEEKPAEE